MIMQQEEHSLSEDKPPSYIDLHSHSFMSGDGVLRVQNLFPDVSGESRLPDYFSIGIHPKNIDPEFVERDLAIMDRVLAENRSGGAIAGIVIGSVFGALIIAYGVCALLYKKKIVKGAFFEKIYPFIKD